ncbi:crotonase/enoyl-CoA hydratase family protein [Nonomuraea cavernae]|uniref:Enoyl CoA dehydratase/isomerase n=1 Tax=Nonomuraea cavernae TaxID=2045107 RepID=A0A917YVR4_9ACTN|nr:crotonase/enoyl-CoA hydratase family protein [Nonomuraea cavernae]MCA2187260.1 crotonase/enoyl-CoA hydratase family protein [Nonomuraea cavernae]GGO68068.1 enoyl CoA dehydratase/isomerase [Nonomuraea cavernae]
MSDEVLVEESDGVAIITINRPKARNAVNGAVARGIAEAVDALDARPDVSAYVLTGAGGTFCAGMDLKGFLTGDVPIVEGRGFGGLTEAPAKKPLVAAIEGYALAGGFELALACDVIVASSESKFGLPEPKRGLVAGAGGIMRLPRRIPYHVAMEIALTGDHYSAARLYELGLVNRITEPGAALDGAIELARRIAANAPLAVAATKKVIIESQDWSLEEMFSKQGAIVNPVFGTKDAMEGAAAFAEKRAPQWKGE